MRNDEKNFEINGHKHLCRCFDFFTREEREIKGTQVLGATFLRAVILTPQRNCTK